MQWQYLRYPRLCEALAAAANYSFAGFDDWRLPNIKELASIVDERCNAPPLNAELFPHDAAIAAYWSSSPAAIGGDFSWYMYNGRIDFLTRVSSLSVLLVCGGS